MQKKHGKGYLSLLKSNSDFRNLWYGQVVSELGDWLNSIAIYALVLQLTDAGMALATVMVAKLLPIFFVSPFAGVVIDRMDRRTVMFVSDVLRFLVVLCFLMIDDKSELWLLYTLVVVEISLAGFFEPARSAIIPSLTAKEDIVTANALSGSTWSVMLALGAALGGVVVSLFGIKTAFVVDAFTFLVSAWFISRIKTRSDDQRKKKGQLGLGGFQSFIQGARYLRSEPIVLVLALLKSGLAISGGIMTLIPLYARKLFSGSSAISMAIGIMYSSRGFGAAIGPVLIKRIFGESCRVLQNSILASFFLSALSFIFLAESYNLWTASACLGFATFFGSLIWVFSSAMIHLEAKEEFMGRIFSLDWAFLTLVMGGSNWGVGIVIDQMGLTPHEAARGIGLMMILPGIFWGGFLLFVQNRLKQGKAVGSVTPEETGGWNAPSTSL